MYGTSYTELTSSENAVLEQMQLGVWYNPHGLKVSAGITTRDSEYKGLLSRMCDKGLLAHGNGISTYGFCLIIGPVFKPEEVIVYPAWWFKSRM